MKSKLVLLFLFVAGFGALGNAQETKSGTTTYQAYVNSDDYTVNQAARTIVGPMSSTPLAEFYNKLYPSFGATLSVLEANGNPSIAADLNLGDKLLVTAADGLTTAVYEIYFNTTPVAVPIAEPIKAYPNPFVNSVMIEGIEENDEIQVIDPSGVVVCDETSGKRKHKVSLKDQQSGLYTFVIYEGRKVKGVVKMIKKK